MRFSEIVDFEYLVRDGRYVIDWEELNDFPLFESLCKALNFDDNGKGRGLYYLQRLLSDKIYTDEIPLMSNIYQKNEDEIKRIIKSEANALEVSYEKRVLDIVEKESYPDSQNLFQYTDESRMQSAIVKYILRQNAEEIEKMSRDNYIFYKKGWFRELENEAFLSNLSDYHIYGDDLEKFYNDIDINNLGDIVVAFDKHFSKKLSNEDLERLYHRNEDYFNINFDLEDLEKTHSLQNFIRTLVIEAIAITAEKYCDKQYAQDELEFYKVEVYETNQEIEDEAHGLYASNPIFDNYSNEEEANKKLLKKLASLGMELGDKVGDLKFLRNGSETILEALVRSGLAKTALFFIEHLEVQKNKEDLQNMYQTLKGLSLANSDTGCYTNPGKVFYMHTDAAILDSLYIQFKEKLVQEEENKEIRRKR